MGVVLGVLAGALAGAVVSHILCEAHFKAIDKVIEATIAEVKEICFGYMDKIGDRINPATHRR